MSTSTSASDQPSTDGWGSAARWAIRIALLLVVLLLLIPLVVFAYPWLVYHGVIG